jgi:hypothetical protein
MNHFTNLAGRFGWAIYLLQGVHIGEYTKQKRGKTYTPRLGLEPTTTGARSH